MTGYTKLFSSIVASTIWREDDKTRIVWITMLALSDQDGFVEGSIPGLADLARVTVADCEQAIKKLQQPDKYSRTPDHDGRRIEVIDGGWFIVNRAKYRDKNWQAEKVERHREANRRYYERRKTQKPDANSDNSYPKVSESDRVGDKKEKEKEKEEPKTLAQLTLSDCETIYGAYPRKVGKAAAVRAIQKAIARLVEGEYGGKSLTVAEAIAGLRNRVIMFAQAPAGRKAKFTPHAATWFNRSSYLDDPKGVER
jgi:hypothetical protein